MDLLRPLGLLLLVAGTTCKHEVLLFEVNANETFEIPLQLDFPPMVATWRNRVIFNLNCDNQLDFCLSNKTDETIYIHGELWPEAEAIVFRILPRLLSSAIVANVNSSEEVVGTAIAAIDNVINEERYVIPRGVDILYASVSEDEAVVFHESLDCNSTSTSPCFKFLPSNVTLKGIVRKEEVAVINLAESQFYHTHSMTLVLISNSSAGASSAAICEDKICRIRVRPNETFEIPLQLTFPPRVATWENNSIFNLDCDNELDFCLSRDSDDTIFIHGRVRPNTNVMRFLKAHKVVNLIKLDTSVAVEMVDDQIMTSNVFMEERLVIPGYFDDISAFEPGYEPVFFEHRIDCSPKSPLPCYKFLSSNATLKGILRNGMPAVIKLTESDFRPQHSMTLVIYPKPPHCTPSTASN